MGAAPCSFHMISHVRRHNLRVIPHDQEPPSCRFRTKRFLSCDCHRHIHPSPSGRLLLLVLGGAVDSSRSLSETPATCLCRSMRARLLPVHETRGSSDAFSLAFVIGRFRCHTVLGFFFPGGWGMERPPRSGTPWDHIVPCRN